MTTPFAVLQYLCVVLTILSIQSTAAEQLRVVFTIPKEDYGDAIGPALLAPIKTIGDDLQVDVNWTIIDTKNTPDVIASAFFSTINDFKPHVIIGEKDNDCCDLMATLASARNTLFISIDCNPFQFLVDRESYPTYASAKSGSFSLGLIVNEVMDQLGYKRVALITTPIGVHIARSRQLKLELEKRDRKVFSYFHARTNYSWDEFMLWGNAIKARLNYLADRATFFVFLMDQKQSENLLKVAAMMGLMSGKHAFLVSSLVEDQTLYSFDITVFDGVLTIDRATQTETLEWRHLIDRVRKGFDTDDWKRKSSWTRGKEFDSEGLTVHTAKQHRKMISAGYLNDAVLLWWNVLKKARATRPNLQWDDIAKEGTHLSMLARDVKFQGVTGYIAISDSLSRANWTVSMIQNGIPKYILLYEDETGSVTNMNPGHIVWPGGIPTHPREPRCFVDQCQNEVPVVLIVICCSLAAAVIAIRITAYVLYVLWKRRQEKELITNWRIIWSDVAPMEDSNTTDNNSADRKSTTPDRKSSPADPQSIANSAGMYKDSDNSSAADRKIIANSGLGRLYTSAGTYKGATIAIKAVPRDSVNIFETTIYQELKELLYVKHDNINPFIGVCVDAPNVCVAMAYAEKGSIQDVLADQQFKIDWEFRTSLALDVVEGMEYLHSSPVGAHGHLTSANCVIDERWVCKITDYGLKLFRCIDKLQRPLREMLWTAPEILLKKENDTIRVGGTKPGDVYSFGIIISELLTRELPYQSGMGSVTLEESVEKVKMFLEPPFRPNLPDMEEKIAAEWIGLAKNCWQTSPYKRPTFRTVKFKLQANQSGKFTNVLERMSVTLEESIDRANTKLLVERRKTEAKLESILPRPVFEQLASGTEFEPQLSDFVTLCLCDTIGFYKATKHLSADVVVDVLKSMYQQYDEISEKYGAFEINTNGSRDSMMLTGGLPINPKVDAEAICTMSLELLSFIGTFTHPSIKGRNIQMKTTIHTGSAYIAVMGKQMPQFTVFGEVIPTTTHLHSFGNNMTIRISSATHDRLPETSGFKIQEDKQVTLKERVVAMYVVMGKEGFTMPLPTPVQPSPTPTPTPRRKSSKVRRRSSGARTKKQ